MSKEKGEVSTDAYIEDVVRTLVQNIKLGRRENAIGASVVLATIGHYVDIIQRETRIQVEPVKKENILYYIEEIKRKASHIIDDKLREEVEDALEQIEKSTKHPEIETLKKFSESTRHVSLADAESRARTVDFFTYYCLVDLNGKFGSEFGIEDEFSTGGGGGGGGSDTGDMLADSREEDRSDFKEDEGSCGGSGGGGGGEGDSKTSAGVSEYDTKQATIDSGGDANNSVKKSSEMFSYFQEKIIGELSLSLTQVDAIDTSKKSEAEEESSKAREEIEQDRQAINTADVNYEMFLMVDKVNVTAPDGDSDPNNLTAILYSDMNMPYFPVSTDSLITLESSMIMGIAAAEQWPGGEPGEVY